MNSIAKYRGKLGISQSELGKMIGVSRTTINVAERGDEITLKEAHFQKLCEVLGCTKFEAYGDDFFRVKPENDEECKKAITSVCKLIQDEELKNKILEVIK